MAKYTVLLEDSMRSDKIIEADSYGTNATTGELYLVKDNKSVGTFARGEWTGCYLTEAEAKK